MTLVLAEKAHGGVALYQGTTLVVPQIASQKTWALAPAAMLPHKKSFPQGLKPLPDFSHRWHD
jgi:hypothetical protein